MLYMHKIHITFGSIECLSAGENVTRVQIRLNQTKNIWPSIIESYMYNMNTLHRKFRNFPMLYIIQDFPIILI